MPKGDRERGKADPDDGTTPVAHLLLEATAAAKLSGVEKGALMILWRKTYGWLKHGIRLKEEHIGLEEWAEALDTNKYYASRVIKSLVKHNIIYQYSLGQGKGYMYSMNTNIASWNGNCISQQLLDKLTTVAKNDNSYPNG